MSLTPESLESFVEVGLALAEVRDHHLYRDKFLTFDDYVASQFGLDPRRAKVLIGLAQQYAARGQS